MSDENPLTSCQLPDLGNLYREMIEQSRDGLAITQDGNFRYVNAAFCDMVGYSAAELIEMPGIDLLAQSEKDRMMVQHYRRMEGLLAPSLDTTILVRKDRSEVIVELSATSIPFQGRSASFISIRDITNRKTMEEELRKTHKRLEEINQLLEQKVEERTRDLTEANTLLFKVQKENLQTRFDVLKQQVNPHFLFNSLNVLTSLIKLEPDLAEKFTEQLAKVYRYVLENKDNELVALATELDFLESYVFLLNIRFTDKLRVNINIPADQKHAEVIPLAVQLLIENAIKHNSMSKKSPLVIDIFVDDKCNLNVINNLQEREARITSTGIGLKNIENRYKLLNNSEPEFFKTESQFIARIPLICDQGKTR
jgi:PAS domain S-box-containing protein